MLELSHIDKYYNPGSVNEMCLFQDFNLTIPDSQFVSWSAATAPARPPC